MTRGKKKETLKPEERLQAALVPESEQPYKVPENWCWVYLQTLCEIPITDGTHKTPKYSDKENGIPFVSAKDVTKGYIDWSAIKYITQELHEELYQRLAPQIDDILLAKNGTTGVATLVIDNYIFDLYVTLAVLRPNKKLISPRYLYYLVNSPVARIQFDTHLTGIGVPNLHLRDIKITVLPLPPLFEQQRIVDRIESLFAKLDEAKQKAQDALDSFETRKAAILHKAFTGELTAQWRKEHGVGMESWQKANLGKYVDSQYGYTESASREQVGPKFLRITDIQDGVVNWANVPFCEISDTDFERYAVSQNDIMVARTGATTGKSYLIVDDVKAVFASYLIRIKIKSPKLQPQYLYDFMQSQMYWGQITEFSAGIAQPGVNAKKLKEIILSIPSVSEQIEIVRILDDLLAKEQQAKEAAEKVLEQIDLIKKSILARAFRGELGTNDPGEESAVELLKNGMMNC